MGMNETPSSERIHIGIFGRRNAGKSSVINAVTGQSLAIVSDKMCIRDSDMGIGVLFGLNNYRYDFTGIIMHAEHMEAYGGVGPHTISVPRVRRADDIDPDVFDLSLIHILLCAENEKGELALMQPDKDMPAGAEIC